MTTQNLGRVQGAGIFYSSATSSTSVAKNTISPTNISPLVGDSILFANGDVRKITAVGSAITCGAVTANHTGANGTNGVGVSSATVTYKSSTSGTVTPTGTWSSTIPSVSSGNYLWTRTITTYTDDTSTTAYSVARQGEDGEDGGATVPTQIYVGSTTASGSYPIPFVNSSGNVTAGNKGLATDTANRLYYNPYNNQLTATAFNGYSTNSYITRSTTASSKFPLIFANNTATSTGSRALASSTPTIQPSTGTITATKFVGDGSGLTNLPTTGGGSSEPLYNHSVIWRYSSGGPLEFGIDDERHWWYIDVVLTYQSYDSNPIGDYDAIKDLLLLLIDDTGDDDVFNRVIPPQKIIIQGAVKRELYYNLEYQGYTSWSPTAIAWQPSDDYYGNAGVLFYASHLWGVDSMSDTGGTDMSFMHELEDSSSPLEFIWDTVTEIQ